MSTVMSVLAAIFWGLLLLSFLVFIHEGGHFLAARALGLRVTEFFLGLPCRFKLSRKSAKYGTEYGVTPILIGGYNKICGMEGSDDELLPDVLRSVMTHGKVDVATVAEDCGCDEERAMDMLVTLNDWASVKPFYDPEKGEKPTQSHYPSVFLGVTRDAEGLTVYDKGCDLEKPGSTQEGEPREAPEDFDTFFKTEKSHVYQGVGFWPRVFLLLAGIVVNVLCGMILIVGVYTISGVDAVTGSNVIGNVVDGSLAQQAGISAGDSIVAVNGQETDDWQAIVNQLSSALETSGFDVTYTHDGVETTSHVTVDQNASSTQFGIYEQTEREHLDVITATRIAAEYVGMTASYAFQLIEPTHTVEVMNNSTSIVGISVVAADAAAQGADQYLFLAALISLSLGFVNLLPIPPLDGGKVIIEIIQAVTRKTLSLKAQAYVSYVGLALFMCMFVYVMRLDILRFIVN